MADESPNATAFEELVAEMKRQGVTAESPEAHRLAELIAALDELDVEYGPRLEKSPEQLEGKSPWLNIDQLSAFIARDYEQDAILETIEEEFAPYLATLRARKRRRRRVARVVGWGIALIRVVLFGLIGAGVFWVIGHPGAKMMGRDITDVIGRGSADALFATVLTGLGVGVLLALWHIGERVYHWAYQEITGEPHPSGARARG